METAINPFRERDLERGAYDATRAGESAKIYLLYRRRYISVVLYEPRHIDGDKAVSNKSRTSV